MNGSSNRDLVEIRYIDSALSVARIFLVNNSCMRKEYCSFYDYRVGPEVIAGMIRPIFSLCDEA